MRCTPFLWLAVVALCACPGLKSTLDAGAGGGAGGGWGGGAGGGGGTLDAGVDGGVDAGPCAGPCLPEAVALQRVLPVDLEVNDTHVLWLEYGPQNQGLEGQLNRMRKEAFCATSDGGCVEDLNTDLLGRFRLAWLTLAAGDFCWLEFYADQRTLSCQSLTTGVERRVAQNQPYAWALTAQGDTLFWVNVGTMPLSKDGAVMMKSRLAPLGEAPVAVAPSRAKPNSVAADVDALYWTELGASTSGGSVFRQARDGGVPELLSSAEAEPMGLRAWGDFLYWANLARGDVRRVRKDGAGGPVTLQAGLSQPFALAVDGRGVYALTAGTGPNHLDGELWRFDADGGARRLVDQLPNTSDVALDATHVWWATQGTPAANYLDGALWRLRRED